MAQEEQTFGSVLPQSLPSSAPQSVVVPAAMFQSWSVPPGAVNPAGAAGVGPPTTGATVGVTCDAAIGAAPHCIYTVETQIRTLPINDTIEEEKTNIYRKHFEVLTFTLIVDFNLQKVENLPIYIFKKDKMLEVPLHSQH